MVAGIEISEITFNDGSCVDCKGHDVVLIVGPNNSGKTQCLRDVLQHLQNRAMSDRNRHVQHLGLVVRGVRIERYGSAEEAWALIKAMGFPSPPGQNQNYQISLPGRGHTALNREEVLQWLDESQVRHLESIFTKYLGPESREQMASPTQSLDFGRELPSHPLHLLHEDAEARRRLSDGFRRAFGQEIALDLLAGKILPLHVGVSACPLKGESEYEQSYRNRLRSYPRIDEQGHGMRSFTGILLHCWASTAQLVIIDEPEAFLHPPQARLLGRLLAEQKSGRRQLIIATHSSDIITGILESPDVRVKVVRLRRDGVLNIARELSHDDIEEVWADPVLRYSRILDGIFYERVVVCEADGDCRFYQAIADALREDEDHTYSRDVMFTQAGGKGGIAKLVRALAKLEVPVVAVADFDLLRERADIIRIVEALGSEFKSIESDYELIRKNIEAMGTTSVADVKANIKTLLDQVPDSEEVLPTKVARKIYGEMKPKIGWKKAKAKGLGVLDNGTPYRAGQSLLESLAGVGLLVVPVGELEAFDPTETAEKNEWVNHVLEKYRGRFATAVELESARDFVRMMIRIAP